MIQIYMDKTTRACGPIHYHDHFLARLLIKKGVLLQLKFGVVGVGVNIYLWAL